MALEKHTVFVTSEQAHRLSALACDALTGIQFDADDGDQSTIHGCFVPVDAPQDLHFFTIDADGTYHNNN